MILKEETKAKYIENTTTQRWMERKETKRLLLLPIQTE